MSTARAEAVFRSRGGGVGARVRGGARQSRGGPPLRGRRPAAGAFAGLLCLSLLVARTGSPAWAQAGPAPSATAGSGTAWRIHGKRSRGLLFVGGFGASGCTDHACDDLDPLVYFRMEGLYRILNFLAVGLHFGMPFADPDSRFVDSAYNVFLAGEARGILPIGPLEIWSGIALGWIRAEERGEYCDFGGCWDGKAWSDGFGFGWGTGAHFYVWRGLAVGMDFWLYKGVYDEVCIETDISPKSCTDVDNDDVGITWMVGASVVYFLPL